MKIFNLENPPKGKPTAKIECVVIATWEEWAEITKAVEAQVKANPRARKLKKINKDLELMAIY